MLLLLLLLQLLDLLLLSRFEHKDEHSSTEAQERHDSGGVGQTRGGGVQHRSAFCAHPVGQEQHPGSDQLQKQQKVTRPRQSVRQVCNSRITNVWHHYRHSQYV